MTGEILTNAMYFFGFAMAGGILVGLFWAVFFYWVR